MRVSVQYERDTINPANNRLRLKANLLFKFISKPTILNVIHSSLPNINETTKSIWLLTVTMMCCDLILQP